MDYTVVMKISESYCDLSCIKFNYFFWEPLFTVKMVIYISSSDVLQEEIDSILILEDIVHAQHERMIRLE